MMRLEERLLRLLPQRPSGRIHEQRFTPEAGGLYGADEPIPEGLLDRLRADWAPDGYLLGAACARFAYGMSCGQILALLEAFPAVPRGLIVADPDPAVVCAWDMLLDVVARHADPVGCAGELFAGGETAWRELEERALSRRAALGLAAVLDPGDRERLWEGLRRLESEGVPADAAGIARRIEEWRANVPQPGEPPLFWSFFFRTYEKLQALAADGRVAVVPSSFSDRDLQSALTELPGFADSTHVIYLANTADTEARRILFAGGRGRLGLTDEESHLSSTPQFVERLNAELRQLGTLAAASRGACFVHSSESQQRMLLAGAEPPQHAPGDFFLQIDLDRVAFALFEAPAEEDDELAFPEGDPWPAARSFRRASLALFGAAVRRDGNAAAAALSRVARELAVQPPGAERDPSFLAFRIAGLAEALLMVRRSGLAEALSAGMGELETVVSNGLRHLEAGGEEALLKGCVPGELFLLAHAFTVGGRLCAAPSWIEEGRRLADAGLELGGDQEEALGLRIQALVHLLGCDLHDSRRVAREAVGRGVAQLFADLQSSWEVRSSPDGSSRGFARYARQPGVAYESARLLFLFQGLRSEALDPIRAVFLLRRGSLAVAAAERSTP